MNSFNEQSRPKQLLERFAVKQKQRNNRRRPTTEKQRRSRRRAAGRMRQLMKRPSMKMKAARTRKLHSIRHPRKRSSRNRFESTVHPIEYVAVVGDYVRLTGNAEVGAKLIEDIDPDLTATPIGHYVMDVSEKIAKTPTGLAMIDACVIDPTTAIFCFEKTKYLNEAAITQVLGQYGQAEVLARPGDAINEDEVSLLYLISLVVDPAALTESEEADDVGIILEDADSELSAIKQIVTDPVFSDLI